MRRCFLHAGGHKTGTSALQHFLLANRGNLRDRGYLVPSAGMRHGSHQQFIRRVAGLPFAPHAEHCLEQMELELKDSGCDNVILSAEIVETVISQDHNFANIIGFLNKIDFEVTIVYYFRNKPQQLTSQYVQRTKTYLLDRNFDRFIASQIRAVEPFFVKVFDTLSSAGVETIFRPYNQQARRSGIARDFLDAIGLAAFGVQDSVVVNQSIGPVGMEAARRSMQEIDGGLTVLIPAQRTRCKAALFTVLKEAELVEQPYCGLTTQMARKVENAYKPDCDEFARRAWGCSWADMFSDDVGQQFEPNDLTMVRPTEAQQVALERVLPPLIHRIRTINRDSQQAESRCGAH